MNKEYRIMKLKNQGQRKKFTYTFTFIIPCSIFDIKNGRRK